jgi:triosephosphate isomerase
MATRRRIVAGNWKMNLDHAGAVALAQAVATGAHSCGDCNLILCPPSIYLEPVAKTLELTNGAGPSGVALGGQNLHDQPKGAFTGEIAPTMLVDVGCTFCIVGHSERRTLFGETDSVVNTKAKAVLAAGLTPIICVGETLEERDQGRTAAVVTEQISGSLAGLSAEDLAKSIIAYEPVWAIGTGKVATPEQAQEVHALIRKQLAEHADEATANQVVIQYGGSVKPGNAGVLAAQPDIDGALVGGASLKAEDFLAIAEQFAHAS